MTATVPRSDTILLKIPLESPSPCLLNKRMWLTMLWSGMATMYAARLTVPSMISNMSKEFHWTGTQVGTLLSSFFWGYSLTKILVGVMSDRFDPARILPISGLGWGLITFWFSAFTQFSMVKDTLLSILVAFWILMGAFQGLYFPALVSLSGKNLSPPDMSYFLSLLTIGGSFGGLFVGTIGSFLKEYFGWQSVTYVVGFIAIMWVFLAKSQLLDKDHGQVIDMSLSKLTNISIADPVPWCTYLMNRSLWACILCHACQNHCLYVLSSWLPSYFQDLYPGEPIWISNTLPWTALIAGSILGRLIQNHMIRNFICIIMECLTLCILSAFKLNYLITVTAISLCFCGIGLHAATNNFHPQELAPKHTGSLFEVIHSAAAIPGFIGVYISGYILDLSGRNWSAVFNLIMVVNIFGWIGYFCFGSPKPIL